MLNLADLEPESCQVCNGLNCTGADDWKLSDLAVSVQESDAVGSHGWSVLGGSDGSDGVPDDASASTSHGGIADDLAELLAVLASTTAGLAGCRVVGVVGAGCLRPVHPRQRTLSSGVMDAA